MKQLEFKVSAKAARLIGRENISDVDGALIELIKNSYDADADSVFVKFDMPFPNVPVHLNMSELKEVFEPNESEEILKYYNADKDKITKKNNLNEEENEKSECQQISCFSFFVRRKRGKKRHEILTGVKNDLVLSKGLFEVVKGP